MQFTFKITLYPFRVYRIVVRPSYTLQSVPLMFSVPQYPLAPHRVTLFGSKSLMSMIVLQHHPLDLQPMVTQQFPKLGSIQCLGCYSWGSFSQYKFWGWGVNGEFSNTNQSFHSFFKWSFSDVLTEMPRGLVVSRHSTKNNNWIMTNYIMTVG